MQQSWLKGLLKHVYAILIFLGLAFLFCSPVLDSMELRQTDNVSWKGMSQEARAYHDSTGINPIWTNAMFGGMPTYQIYMSQDNYTYYLHEIATLGLPKPVNFYFLAMIGFYFLLSVMNFRWWISVMGAIAFGFTSYNAMIIAAGHDTKMFTLAYMAPLLAGILLAYRGKYFIGGIITCITLCLMITSGHYQMLYYMLIVCLCIGIAYLVNAIRNKQLPQFLKATGMLVGFGILSVLPSTVSLWTTTEFGKYTMRGGHSELTPEAGQESDKTKGGLDKSYAFNWSEGIMETLTIVAPNLYGGPSTGPLPGNGEMHKQLVNMGVPQSQADQLIEQMPRYWGGQPMTDGGVYWGAIILFFFVLALFIVKDFNKGWIVAACIIGVILAWGDNLSFINYFLFDHLPLYNKFRAPAQALVIPQVLVPFFACWGLNQLINDAQDKVLALKNLKKALYVTGGLALLLLLGSFGMFSFTHSKDFALQYFSQFVGDNQEMLNQLITALKADRASLLRIDALRSLVFIIAAFGLCWAWLKGRLAATPVLAILAGLVAIDQMWISNRYLDKENYVTPSDYSAIFAPSPVDTEIKKDPDPYYRVFNTARFEDAISSYHHKSVGGYSPVKLALYQDLIQHQLSKGTPGVINMLNTKYVIFQTQQGQLSYQQNPAALGNAWFVDSLVWAKNADVEMKTLDSLPTDHAAVIDERFRPSLNGFTPGKDSASHIKLTKYGLNELHYTSSNSKAGLAVFSDIYYPAGWKLTVDGKEEEILRVNYLLRAAKIPAGNHAIVMKFEPESYYLGNKITAASSITMLVLLALAIAFEIIRQRKANAKKETAK
ncbi:YfhO family protein [Chitinophaga deserti]|uniref:YfhO family protein n=1 Tax=Chitinophaga deserti TaxID=2164099 RepID=UPI000D6BB88E|nr:YfhO family protein [Chitinophaga deserti]